MDAYPPEPPRNPTADSEIVRNFGMVGDSDRNCELPDEISMEMDCILNVS